MQPKSCPAVPSMMVPAYENRGLSANAGDTGYASELALSSMTAENHCNADEKLLPVFRTNNVPIFFSCDDKFLPHAMTAIASIMENGGQANNYDIFIIGQGLEERKCSESIEWMKQYVNGHLRFLDAGDCMKRSDATEFYVTKTYPLSVYFRFFAPTLFANYDKIIYLDSDLVVLTDIAELYRYDIDDFLLAAAHDQLAEEDLDSAPDSNRSQHGRHIGFRPGDSYFNSGVMLLNLRKMREEGIQEKLMAATRIINAPSLPDQDILNYVCKGRVSFINAVWNFQDWMAETESTSVRAHFANQALRETSLQGRNSYKILHYTESKPWSFKYTGSKSGYYWRYLKTTPFFQPVADELRRKTRVSAKLVRFVYLSYHLLRCVLPYLFTAFARKEQLGRRMFSYWLQMKSLFMLTLRQRMKI